MRLGLKKRKADSHKGDYGHVFVLAGSLGMTGAAALCSMAALRSGAGLVTLGIPRSLNALMGLKLTEVMTLPLPETRVKTLSLAAFGQIKNFMKKIDVLIIGPGLSRNPDTQRLVRKLVSEADKPAVIDADGLNALAGKVNILKRKKASIILTPHPGEMSRLVGKKIIDDEKNRKKIACEFAKKFDVVVALKGHRTVVASPTGRYVNKTGNPGMATAGSGDVLTGMIGGLLAQRMRPFEAAKAAVYLHGLAGDIAARKKGQISMTAGDILSELPQVFKKAG